MESKNIFRRMADITAELQTVAKNLNVETGRGKSYKAVSERDIIDAVKPLEYKHGVYSYPVSRRVLESQTLESENEYQGKVTKKTTFFTRIETVYRFVNVDDPEDYIETTTFAEGIDPQDKGSGKAMTYADKYALMKGYKISTGDDPDQNGSEETHYTTKGKANRGNPYSNPDPNTGEVVFPSQNTYVPTCAACGAEITEKVHDFSVKKFKRPLCMKCQNKYED